MAPKHMLWYNLSYVLSPEGPILLLLRQEEAHIDFNKRRILQEQLPDKDSSAEMVLIKLPCVNPETSFVPVPKQTSTIIWGVKGEAGETHLKSSSPFATQSTGILHKFYFFSHTRPQQIPKPWGHFFWSTIKSQQQVLCNLTGFK